MDFVLGIVMIPALFTKVASLALDGSAKALNLGQSINGNGGVIFLQGGAGTTTSATEVSSTTALAGGNTTTAATTTTTTRGHSTTTPMAPTRMTTAPKPVEGNDAHWIPWVAVACIVVVAALIVALVCFLARRKRKSGKDTSVRTSLKGYTTLDRTSAMPALEGGLWAAQTKVVDETVVPQSKAQITKTAPSAVSQIPDKAKAAMKSAVAPANESNVKTAVMDATARAKSAIKSNVRG